MIVCVRHLLIALLALVLNAIFGGQFHTKSAIAATSRPREEQSASRAVDWRKAARDDVLAAYEIFQRHHPGMFDPRNPSFPRTLRRARDTALAFAARVNDAEGHARTLALFSSVLADGHARVQAAYSGHADVLWPGFRTVWRGQDLRVVGPIDAGLPIGSALVGCDGKDARIIILEGDSWFEARLAEPGQWWEFAPLTFLRSRSPYEKLPSQCRFRSPDGHEFNYPLRWRAISKRVLQTWMEQETKRDPIGLTEPKRGIYMISLPTFSPDAEGRVRYQRLFRDIEEKFSGLNSAKTIVIDLRHNGGGSSSWGERVAYSLWGESAVKAKMAHYFRKTRIWWLADAANIEHFRQSAAELRAEGRDDEAFNLDELVRHLTLALTHRKRFYIEDYGSSLKEGHGKIKPHRLPPVYVVTDGKCASACLDALDIFTRFPNVMLIGAPTSADSTYLDVRFQPLPSDRGVVILPTKIWVQRPRHAGEVYRPQILVDDLDWTTATMLQHVEQDLARHP